MSLQHNYIMVQSEALSLVVDNSVVRLQTQGGVLHFCLPVSFEPGEQSLPRLQVLSVVVLLLRKRTPPTAKCTPLACEQHFPQTLWEFRQR